MVVSDKYTETVIPDHSLSGLSVEEGNTEAAVSDVDIACLLFLYLTHRKDRLAVDVFGHKLFVELSLSGETLAMINRLPKTSNLNASKVIKNGLVSELERTGWLELVRPIINVRADGGFKSPPLFVEVYANETTLERNSTFSFYFNRSNNRFFLNASCAPTQVLLGQNSLPVAVDFGKLSADRLLQCRAQFLVDMFCLPFIVMSNLIDQYICRRFCDETNHLKQLLADGGVLLQKIQLAAYSSRFDSVVERNLALAGLYQTLSAQVIHVEGKRMSVNVAEAFNCKFENSRSTAHYEKHGESEHLVISGFMLRHYHSHKPTYSLGFYAKDQVQRENFVEQRDKLILYQQAPVDTNKDSLDEVVAATQQSIRLDLSIHTEGLRLLSKHLHKHDSTIPELQNLQSGAVRDLLYAVLRIDSSLGLIFGYVLKDQFRFDQLFGTTAKQWNMAWDYLKSKGYYDLIKALRSRATLNGNGSFTALVKQHCPGVDPSRLRREVQRLTANQHYDNEDKFLPGVDLQFPYRAVQLVRRRLQEMYEDPDAIEQLYETGHWPNDYDPHMVAKKARKSAYKMYHKVLHGGIKHMPCLTGIKISIS